MFVFDMIELICLMVVVLCCSIRANSQSPRLESLCFPPSLLHSPSRLILLVPIQRHHHRQQQQQQQQQQSLPPPTPTPPSRWNNNNNNNNNNPRQQAKEQQPADLRGRRPPVCRLFPFSVSAVGPARSATCAPILHSHLMT